MTISASRLVLTSALFLAGIAACARAPSSVVSPASSDLPAPPASSSAPNTTPPPPPAASATSSAAPVASAPLAPGACPAASSKAPPSAFADDDGIPGPSELPLGDVDGDGVPEIVVSYPASYTERGILVLKTAPAPACFEVLYEGVGEGAGLRTKKTNGHIDLSVLLLPITSNGRGMALAIARFDGHSYKLVAVEKCAGIDGKRLPKKECDQILRSYTAPQP